MTNDEILRRLDLMQATLAIAFDREISAARVAVRADGVNAAILDATGEWIASTDLQASVASSAKVSERSVRDRFPELLARRILEARGSDRRMEYRGTGIL